MNNPKTSKPDKKTSYKERRLQAKKEARSRKLTWITLAVVAVFIVGAITVLAQSKSKPLEVAYDQLPVLGEKTAPVKIVELGDFKCPTCQWFSQTIEPRLKKDFIDKGTASLYFMNFTIIGEDSKTAALAGQAVFHQSNDEYWKYYDALYKNQGDEKVAWATPQFLTDVARKAGLKIDYDKLQNDIVSKTYQKELDEQNAFADRNRFNGTPTLLINGRIYTKALDYATLKAEIEKAAQEAK
ncbi:DsbA family protein [Paenibacillus sp. P25]|nr:DsbA family protein [Paenibacillus sp. P25]